MHVEPHFFVRPADDLKAGSLFRSRYGGKGALGILLRRLEDGGAVCALLEAPAEAGRLPAHMRVGPGGETCMDYGTGWDLELIEGPESFPGNSDFWNIPGAIHASSDGLYLHLAPPPGEIAEGAADVDLATGEFAPTLRHKLAVPFMRWRIWARPAMRAVPGTTPLFSFPKGK